MSYTNNTINATTGLPTVDIFLWENSKMIDLGTLGGVFSYLNAANNRGQVAGFSDLAVDLTKHPIIGDRNGMKDLGTLGGDNGTANWLNDEGQVVGSAGLPGDVSHHAFVWQSGVMTDLGTIDGDGCSNGVGINSLGQAVGTSTDCRGNVLHLFLWEHGSITDLSALILPGSDVTFNDPTFINDHGEITGNGTLANGDTHAVLLLPCDDGHPGVQGCDYSMVDAASAQTSVSVARPLAVTQQTTLSPSQTLNSFRNRYMQRYRLNGQRR